MSLSSEILGYIISLPETDRLSLSPQDVAQATGHPSDKVSKLMWSLEHTGRLKLRRDGRNIVGVEGPIRSETRQGISVDSPRSRKASGEASPASPKQVKTPTLDAYIRAKGRMESIRDTEESQYIEVTFRDNPLAEEALTLRTALIRMEGQYAELSTQYKMTLYEYEGVKARMRDKATRGAIESGAVATSGD